ncbi:MAG: hypothetical protein UT41_C0001G0252 [Candidatus Wolfebacteria bacterium GW2011_GWC2_39_22]|uniref:Uncharacterized protein n=2 Tax=Candidatus Wolfeibacteriota TaxID=1752735 RepID=A0A0G1HA63_9BACT|nr:MAG: hypothetical protein UT41_C0001G0252 [Candidatus Wolfebacteria bacterium GW2011_GWC2_39_22]KKT43640.1 MAG: hypothetical protein UW32_C0001G0232 [Candidatus Wolfebacteria bacterium GW2011_GWE2_44_13]HBI25630.1 hypothetical protein [Candidatus Wolfebacteria bacterium]
MNIQIEQAVARALESRMALLEQIFSEATDEATATAAAVWIALVGTEASATKLLELIKQCDCHDDFESKWIIMAAFVGFSPYRHTRKQELLDLFQPEEQDGILRTYEEVDMTDKRILDLPPLHKAIQEAYEWNDDDSGD